MVVEGIKKFEKLAKAEILFIKGITSGLYDFYVLGYTCATMSMSKLSYSAMNRK